MQAEVKSAEARLKEDQQRVESKSARNSKKINQQDVSALEAYVKERKEIESSISADVLPRYERVRKHRGGIAVAQRETTCATSAKCASGLRCSRKSARTIRLIACDACQRILYFPENLDHPFEVA